MTNAFGIEQGGKDDDLLHVAAVGAGELDVLQIDLNVNGDRQQAVLQFTG